MFLPKNTSDRKMFLLKNTPDRKIRFPRICSEIWLLLVLMMDFLRKNSIHVEFIKHKSKQQIELFGIIL